MRELRAQQRPAAWGPGLALDTRAALGALSPRPSTASKRDPPSGSQAKHPPRRLTSGQVLEAEWDRKEPAVTGEGDAGAGLAGTGGMRAALDIGRQGEDVGVVMLASPRAAAAAAAASTWRCCSGACWAAS